MTRTRTSPPVRRHRLLVVDDEAYNVDLIRRTFHRTSLVFPAADLAQAEAVLEAEPIDLVLVDYQLVSRPGGRVGDASGLDLARIVRARRPGTPIVMVTGYADLPAMAEALALGVIDELVAKPWSPAELRALVAIVLARR